MSTVEPIKTIEELKKIEKILSKNKRDCGVLEINISHYYYFHKIYLYNCNSLKVYDRVGVTNKKIRQHLT